MIESIEYLSLIMLFEDNLRKICGLSIDLIDFMENNDRIISLNQLADCLAQIGPEQSSKS
jgi:hypothetical protein